MKWRVCLSVTAKKPPLKDRLIPWYFVAAFAVVFVVNGIFAYVAVSTNQGVVIEHPYETGLAYDDVLAEKYRQEALGWQSLVSYDHGALQFVLHDAQGKPISGATVTAHIERPIEKGIVKDVFLYETKAGQYQADLSFPTKGQWDITVSSLWKQQYHQTHKRLVVR